MLSNIKWRIIRVVLYSQICNKVNHIVRSRFIAVNELYNFSASTAARATMLDTAKGVVRDSARARASTVRLAEKSSSWSGDSWPTSGYTPARNLTNASSVTLLTPAAQAWKSISTGVTWVQNKTQNLTNSHMITFQSSTESGANCDSEPNLKKILNWTR